LDRNGKEAIMNYPVKPPVRSRCEETTTLGVRFVVRGQQPQPFGLLHVASAFDEIVLLSVLVPDKRAFGSL
jgi:hypothetical protein